MTSAPNPFADEPLPTTGQRLESAASPLNPYAAPASAEEYNPVAPPGIGLWREGPLLVMHVQAIFPSRCLVTGEESASRRWQPVRWYYPIDWSTRTLQVEYAVSPEAQRRISWRRNISIVIASAGALILGTAILGSETILPYVGSWGILICVVAIIAGLHHGLDAGRALKFRKVRYPYLWLDGAQPPFLNSLPTWPGIGGH